MKKFTLAILLACALLLFSQTSQHGAPGGGAQPIASGQTTTSSVGALTSTSCATIGPVTATGVTSSDRVTWNADRSIKALAGFTPATTGGPEIAAYPGSGTVSFDVCNWSTLTLTPATFNLNWSVVR